MFTIFFQPIPIKTMENKIISVSDVSKKLLCLPDYVSSRSVWADLNCCLFETIYFLKSKHKYQFQLPECRKNMIFFLLKDSVIFIHVLQNLHCNIKGAYAQNDSNRKKQQLLNEII